MKGYYSFTIGKYYVGFAFNSVLVPFSLHDHMVYSIVLRQLGEFSLAYGKLKDSCDGT